MNTLVFTKKACFLFQSSAETQCLIFVPPNSDGFSKIVTLELLFQM